MEFLEDLRDDDLNKHALALNTKPPLFNYINYNNYSIIAYKYTIQNLQDLESSEKDLNYGLQSIPAITMWFLALESFINSILKISCIKNQTDYQKPFFLSISNKYLLLLENFKLTIANTEKDKLINKLNDFERFYKYIPYDSFENEKLVFYSTNFSGRTNFVNQIDVLQAFLISYELFEAFRFVIKGIDLIPNISLMTNDKKIVFEKLNVLKDKILIPSTNDILNKHKLKTKLNLVEKFVNYPVSELFEVKQVLPIFKYQHATIFNSFVSKSKTSIISHFHTMFIRKYEGMEIKGGIDFTTPDFYL